MKKSIFIKLHETEDAQVTTDPPTAAGTSMTVELIVRQVVADRNIVVTIGEIPALSIQYFSIKLDVVDTMARLVLECEKRRP